MRPEQIDRKTEQMLKRFIAGEGETKRKPNPPNLDGKRDERGRTKHGGVIGGVFYAEGKHVKTKIVGFDYLER